MDHDLLVNQNQNPRLSVLDLSVANSPTDSFSPNEITFGLSSPILSSAFFTVFRT